MLKRPWSVFEGPESQMIVQGIIVSVWFVLSFASLLFPAMKPPQPNARIPWDIIDAISSLALVTTLAAKSGCPIPKKCGSPAGVIALII